MYSTDEKVKQEILSQSLAIPHGEINKLFVGGENGNLYSVNRFGATPGVELKYEAHNGPITTVACHPMSNSAFAELILTSSVDWSVKLWTQKVKSIFITK